MVASTAKISKLIHHAGRRRVNSEVRNVALAWIGGVLFTGLLCLICYLLGITPAVD
jgi:hypothetical protein